MPTDRTIIIGIGNTIRCDDGAGVLASRELKKFIKDETIEIVETAEAGVNLLDMVSGYDKLIIIDAIQTKGGRVGDIYRFTIEDIAPASDLLFSHNSGINMVLEWGKKTGLDMPRETVFYAIEARECDVFSEDLSLEVRTAIPLVAERIISELKLSI